MTDEPIMQAFAEMVRLGLLVPDATEKRGRRFLKTAKAKGMGEDAFGEALEVAFARAGVEGSAEALMGGPQARS